MSSDARRAAAIAVVTVLIVAAIVAGQPNCWYSKPEWWTLIVAGLTGCFICWQSWETRKSANAARDTAGAARDSIRLVITKERARLRVEVGELRLIYPVVPPANVVVANTVDFKIMCYGSTEASEVECRAFANIWESEVPFSGELKLLSMNVPGTITPNAEPIKCSAFIYNAITLSQSEIDKVIAGIRSIHICVSVRYKHLFSEDWQTTNFRAFGKFYPYASPVTGSWVRCGNDEDNAQT